MNEIVYKVVRVLNGKMTSVYASAEYEKKYIIGKTTKADIGYLFSFKNIELARKWKNERKYMLYDNEYCFILECVVDNIIKTNRKVVSSLATPDYVKNYWKSYNKFINNSYYNQVIIPEGTVFSKKITPIRIVSCITR